MAPPTDIEASYHSINQFFVVANAPAFIAFLTDVFNGVEARPRDLRPDGTIGHGDVAIGDSHVMLSDATEEYPARPSVSYAYVGDVDAVYARAVAAGCTDLEPPADRAWGDRVGGFIDPFANRWWVATPAAWR